MNEKNKKSVTPNMWHRGDSMSPLYQSSNLVGTLRLIDSFGLRVERPRPGQAVDGFHDILADPSPILMPTSIQPCLTCVLGLFMCYRGWITAVPYMPSIQLWLAACGKGFWANAKKGQRFESTTSKHSRRDDSKVPHPEHSQRCLKLHFM